MFHGSIPADLRSILAERAASWPRGSNVYIGCSGNFTIERTLNSLGLDLRMHSNDVQLYSSTLGWYFSKTDPIPVSLKPEAVEVLPWLEPYLRSPVDVAATVMLGSDHFQWIGREGKSTYYARMSKAMEQQWPRLHARTVDRLTASSLTLASYTPADVIDWISGAPSQDDPVIMFPPFFAGDYEAQFSAIDAYLDWPRPEYKEFDDESRDRLVSLVSSRRHWVLGLHQQYDELRGFLRGAVQTANRGVRIYIYASGRETRIVVPRQQIEHVMAPRVGPGDTLGKRLSIAPLTHGQFAVLRSQYMNHNIRPGSAHMPIAVTVDGVVVGAFALNAPKFDPTEAYLLSDFPVAPTSYKNLAKLVLVAALSKETRFLLERSLSLRILSVRTTAFTKRPVSMKYRSLFRLHARVESPDPLYKWQLDYHAGMGQWTLEEGFAMWKKKWGQVADEDED